MKSEKCKMKNDLINDKSIIEKNLSTTDLGTSLLDCANKSEFLEKSGLFLVVRKFPRSCTTPLRAC
jgi:hypothetical protein